MIYVNRIYSEDCNKFMDRLKTDGKTIVDVIVTSPPYNIRKRYNTYKDEKTEADYVEWLFQVAKKSFSILRLDGSFFLNISANSNNPSIPYKVLDKFICAGYKLQNTIHWIKSISIEREDVGRNNDICNKDFSVGHFRPIKSNRYLTNLHEYVFHFTKLGDKQLDKLSIGVPYQDKSNIKRWKSVNTDKRDRGNVWFISYPTIQSSRSHPAIFPIKLAKLCIRLHGYNKENFLVYDPFMGIGNTALACIDLGIDYIGTEIDDKYITYANETIAKKKINS